MNSHFNVAALLKKTLLTLAWLFVFFYEFVWLLSSTLLVVNASWSLPDFKALYLSGKIFWETGHAYPDGVAPSSISFVLINSSPPPGTLVFIALSWLPIEAVLILWYLVSFTILGFAFSRVWKIYPTDSKSWAWPFLFLFISSPFFLYVYLANWAGLITAFVLLAWYFLRKGDEIKGGIFLGLSLLIRHHPLVILFFLFITKRWKTVIVSLVTSGSIYFVVWLLLGTNNYFEWLRQGLGAAGAVGVVNNRYQHSWYGLTGNIFSLLEGSLQADGPARWLYYGLSLLTLAIVLPLSRKVDFDRGYSMIIILALLIITPSAEYYNLMLVLPLALLWRKYPLVCGLVTARLIAHNPALFINFGKFDDLFWTSTIIIGLIALLVCLYRSNPKVDGAKRQVEQSRQPASL